MLLVLGSARVLPRAIFRRLGRKTLFGGTPNTMRDAYASQNLAAIAKDGN